MVNYNPNTMELAVKVVYFGPALSGKTENIRFLHRKYDPTLKQELLSLKTETDRTLYFDYFQVRAGIFRGVKLRFNLYSVPGQVFYNEARKLVMDSVDAIIFVVDSKRERFIDNQISLNDMLENLRLKGRAIDEVPIVFQYNKRDNKDILSILELNKQLNLYAAPFFEASAIEGKGVIETFKKICKLSLIYTNKSNKEIFASEFSDEELVISNLL